MPKTLCKGAIFSEVKKLPAGGEVSSKQHCVHFALFAKPPQAALAIILSNQYTLREGGKLASN
jgi:hypothetical protein